MGVKGLLKLVYPYMERVNISKWANKRVAVDASTWLQQFSKNPERDLDTLRYPASQHEPTSFKHVYSCMQRIRILALKFHIKLVLVFEGAPLPCKRGESNPKQGLKGVKGAFQGDSALHDLSNALDRSNVATDAMIPKEVDGNPNFKTKLSIQQKEAHELRHLIRSNDDLKGHVECITAPYEASAQIAYLCRTNYTELAIGDDSNLIIYGAPRILFKMDNKGDGMLLNVEALVTEKIYDNGQRLVDWSPALLLGIAALAGCDYIRALPNVDLMKALAYLSAFGGGVEGAIQPLLDASGVNDTHLDGIVRNLGLSLFSSPHVAPQNKKKKSSSKDNVSSFSRFTCYRAAVYRCRLIYLYQRVFDPLSRCCRFGRDLPVSPAHLAQFAILAHFDARLLKSETTTAFQQELGTALLGPEIPDAIATDIAEGRLNPLTLAPFPDPQLTPKKYRTVMSSQHELVRSLPDEEDELDPVQASEDKNSAETYNKYIQSEGEEQQEVAFKSQRDINTPCDNYVISSKSSKSLLLATSALASFKENKSKAEWVTSKSSSQSDGVWSKKLSEFRKKDHTKSPTIETAKTETSNVDQINNEHTPRKNSWLQSKGSQGDESRTQIRKRLRQANPKELGLAPEKANAEYFLLQNSHQSYTSPRRIYADAQEISKNFSDVESEGADMLSIENASQRDVYIGKLSQLIKQITSEQVTQKNEKISISNDENKEFASDKSDKKTVIASPIPKFVKRHRVPLSAPTSCNRSNISRNSGILQKKSTYYNSILADQTKAEVTGHLLNFSQTHENEGCTTARFKVKSFISPIACQTQPFDASIDAEPRQMPLESLFFLSPRGNSSQSMMQPIEKILFQDSLQSEDSSLFTLTSPTYSSQQVERPFKLKSQEF